MVFPVLLGVGLFGFAALWLAGLGHVRTHAHPHALGSKGGAIKALGAKHVGVKALGAKHVGVKALGAKAGRVPIRVGARAPTSATPLSRVAAARGSTNEAPLAVADHEDARAAWLGRLLTLVSPITWSGLLIGAGAAGTLATLAGATLSIAWAVACAGALVFQLGVIGPVSRGVLQFASRPASHLEGCLFQEVEAVTRFNAKGEGLVRVVVDGRSEDVLAVLTKEEREKPGRVDRGARLVIEEVNSKQNRCSVSRAS
ncbi:MAG TPA: hypothetical protein VGM56_29140 [Byssovorax sp.]|jgi:hypothetical protein